MSGTRISVVICVYNGQRHLRACLESICAERYQEKEIIVIDDGSVDGTPAIIEEYRLRCPLRVHTHRENRGLMVSRNIGARMATGEIVAYTDADCVVSPDWIATLVAGFDRDPRIVLVGGRILNPPPRSYPELITDGIESIAAGDAYVGRIFGCNMAVRRSFLLQNPFDERFRYGCDEIDLCYRARRQALRIYYRHAAVVTHYHRATWRSLLRQRFGYGKPEWYVRVKNGVFPPIPVKTLCVLIAGGCLLVVPWYPVFRWWALAGAGCFLLWMTLLELSNRDKPLFRRVSALPGRIAMALVQMAGQIYGMFVQH